MDKHQQNNRRSAAYQFMSSLDELEAVLKDGPEKAASGPVEPPEVNPRTAPQRGHRDSTNMETWLDDAVQDIERFMAEDIA